MNKEQLLKPRWKVIADFPDSDYKVGSIEDRDWCKYVNSEDETDGIVWKISDFPHLFKELNWWEERKIEDLPNYIKIVDENVIAKVEEHSIGIGFTYKVTDYFTSEHSRRKVYSTNTIPSCEEDFLSALANREGLHK